MDTCTKHDGHGTGKGVGSRDMFHRAQGVLQSPLAFILDVQYEAPQSVDFPTKASHLRLGPG